MASHPIIVGLDVGTTNIKAIAAEPDGHVLQVTSRPTPTHHPRQGWATYRPDDLWKTVCDALSQLTGALDEPDRIASIAVASVGETGFPVDADGNALDDGIAWFDARTKPQAEWLRQHVGADPIYQTCRMSIQPIYGLCKLLWLRDNKPDLLDKVSTWLNTADYIAFRLSGERASEPSLAARALLLDVDAFDWATDLLSECGLDPGLLPPLKKSGEGIGHVTAAASDVTGLPVSAVVATGGHDHVCGALAVGVTEPGTILNSLGTAEAHFTPLENPLYKPESSRQGYSVGGHVAWDRYYAIGGLYSSGGSVNWVRELLRDESGDLNRVAGRVAPGSLGVMFMPHLRIANPPFGDAPSRGAFVGLTGDVTREVLYRSVLEGIAFEARICQEGLLAYTDSEKPERIVAIGGSTRNDLLMQIKAAVYASPITVPEVEEGTALGAAILGGLGSGVYKGLEDVLATVERKTRTVEPDPSLQERYAQSCETYSLVYPALKELNERIETQDQ